MQVSRRKLLQLMGASAALVPAVKLQAASAPTATSLKTAYQQDFLIGAALSASIINQADPQLVTLIARDFNSITPENCMKWGEIRNADGSWKWADADAFVAFGEQHNLHMVGHTLVWHSQIPDSVFKNKDGNYISKTALQKKMQEHITTLAGRYKGKLHAWDVVNEAVDDNLKMRESHWYKILGEDFIYQAFNLAHEVDPKAHLLYNDYNIERTGKREATIEMIKRLQKRGMPIHGLGIQGHMGIDTPPIAEVEKSIIEFAKLGLRVHFTELDIDVLPSVWELPVAEISTRFEYKPERDPYTKGLPQEMQDKLARRYEDLFKLFLKHADKIDRVTLWGVSDDASWLNDFPIRGRTNYPLLFDRQHEPKPAYFRVLDLKQ
ncbi:endo-1,4-beta-xylanase [Cellvibrio japonicus]|uniref:Beta-xylanase n=1 Tax=Cellvibrio japonicus (strain Ueda107) TaxID=498211 RepID=B3PC74_CELJU|nr:endo-1,4-beta-xylanase [Cellvibrio japonicus]ACE84280.1 endo-1,4-beta-xylanase, xyn10D [Cellvibrio japonicus Ueda107]QEI13215.1 endo-1,4-beta-xylanase [Cellvibrio japonicus]QEI16789.1 endo-1,4-beta-xylanase [Cellvibrio japonicus]QEI20367.1 endo-1,4-beta-xylanase [Cellvibrio japonicus]